MNTDTKIAKPDSKRPDYTLRRGELSAYGRALNSSRSLRRLTLTVGALLFLCGLITLFGSLMNLDALVNLSVIALITVSLAGLYLIWKFTARHFFEPDLAFRKWLQQVCDGDLDARIGLPRNHQHYKELDFHTRNLTASLAQLSDEMTSLVEQQTDRLKNRGRVLEMLLRLSEDVAAESNKAEVLKTVCQHLADWFGNASVSGYLFDNKTMVSVIHATSGIPVNGDDTCFDGYAVDNAETISEVNWDTVSGVESISRVRVPFFQNDQQAGLVVVCIAAPDSADRKEFNRVLLAVSEQLTLFSNKLVAREEIERSRLVGERTRLAADMHDSLAQTLLAARYKASLLEEELQEAGSTVWSEDMQKIVAALAEANTEIRELMREYRSPLAEHRSVDQIQLAIEQFRQTNELLVFFQSEDPLLRFTPREELVVQRIIGEALINAEKYAKAKTARIFLQYLSDGSRTVLVEDDGEGFNVDNMMELSQQSGVDSGEHIGLSIMQERATSVGAIFSIESEPGEGTRVSLRLPPMLDTKAGQ